MLNPSKDRLDYGKILKPPAGYDLEFAVGTTYSLDLDALVGACLSLSLAEEMDSEIADNPICLLESLRKSVDNIALFCEGGQIHVPGNASSLYVFLEKMIFPVITKKNKHLKGYPSFHPKVWVVKYNCDGKKDIYRFIVMSRNLTYDRSWDVVYSMDGTKGKSSTDKNEPLSDFLLFLAKEMPDSGECREKKKKIRQIARELSNVRFEIEGKEFRDYEFIPTGIKNSAGQKYSILDHELFTETLHEIFVMSPFLSNDIVKDFNESKGWHIENAQYTLITRREALNNIKKENADNFDIYTLKNAIVDGESNIPEEDDDIKRQDIHAKLFLTRKYSATELYLGSLNATHSAVYGNIEFMIRLSSTKARMNSDILKKELFRGEEGGKDDPFEKVNIDDFSADDDEKSSKFLDDVIKAINRAAPKGYLETAGDSYSLKVFFDQLDVNTEGLKITLRPITLKTEKPFEREMVFSDITITGISEMFVLSVCDGEQTVKRVIIISIDNIPEEREKAIVSSIVSNKKGFYNYVAFLLGDDALMSMLEIDQSDSNVKNATGNGFEITPAIYEKMLKAAANDPEKLKGIDYLIGMINEKDVIPEEFKRLYDTVKKAVGLDG